MALTLALDDKLSPRSSVASPSCGLDAEPPSSSWTMELSRWRVRLRRLKRWSRYEGRASDGQFDTHDVPETQRLRSASEQPRLRHSLTSVGSVATASSSFLPARAYRRAPTCELSEPVVPPVRIPSVYRQQDRQRGVRVGGDRVPFTLDGHRRRRKILRPLPRILESEPLECELLPDMRNSLAMVYARMGRPTRERRASSV